MKRGRASQPPKPKAMFNPSPELAQVIGPEPLQRPEALKKLWAYVKQEGLQDPKDMRGINADAKLNPAPCRRWLEFRLARNFTRHGNPRIRTERHLPSNPSLLGCSYDLQEAAEKGVSPLVIQSMSGHTTMAMTERYSHIGLDAKRRALEEKAEPGKETQPPDESSTKKKLDAVKMLLESKKDRTPLEEALLALL